MRIPFNIKYRDKIESGEYKVETRDGKPARILCWDKVDECGQYIVALVQYTPDHENMISVCEDGIYKGTYGHGYDLFIVTPEEELNAWEKAVGRAIAGFQLIPRDNDGMKNIHDVDAYIKKNAAELLAIARKQLQPEIEAEMKEALKDLPRWKKIGRGNNYSSETKFTINGRYLEMNDTLNNVYEVSLSELEKLPKEDEK